MRKEEINLVRLGVYIGCGLTLLFAVGCWSPKQYRNKADRVAQKIIHKKQQEALGRTNSEPFSVERPGQTLRRRLLGEQDLMVSSAASYGSERLPETEHQPEPGYPESTRDTEEAVAELTEGEPVTLSLEQALKVAARNSREYQGQKESVYRAALDLDLEIDQFRNTYQGLLDSIFSTDLAGDTVTGIENTGEAGVTRRLKSGATLTSRLIVDLAKLLSNSEASSMGLAADASITVPLLRGAGRHIVTEPLTQAERNVLYAIWNFNRFKREFAVSIVEQYYSTLRAQDQVENAGTSYTNQVLATRRTRAMLEENPEGRSPGDLDQARSSELQSRNRWISARQSYTNSLDSFKIRLGLPTDARVRTDEQELERLTEQADDRLQLEMPTLEDLRDEPIPMAEAPVELEDPAPEERGPFEIPEEVAMRTALTNRLDLRGTKEQVYDAQRQLYITADRLKPSLNLVGDASIGQGRSLGSADLPNAELRPEEGFYSGGLQFDLPFERTAERNAYRQSYIQLEQAVRDLQALEDEVKQDIRLGLRALVEQRESYRIQIVARRVANRRVARVQAMQEAGRAVSARDINEAIAAKLEAENQVTAALIDYRIGELELQVDMGVLEVTEDGLYREVNPETLMNES